MIDAGALLTAIARRVLFLPVMRYVDDFFSVSRAGTAKCAMDIFARSTCFAFCDGLCSHRFNK